MAPIMASRASPGAWMPSKQQSYTAQAWFTPTLQMSLPHSWWRISLGQMNGWSMAESQAVTRARFACCTGLSPSRTPRASTPTQPAVTTGPTLRESICWATHRSTRSHPKRSASTSSLVTPLSTEMMAVSGPTSGADCSMASARAPYFTA